MLNRYTVETAEQAEEVTEQAEEATAEQKTAIIMLLLYWILSATAEQKKQKLLKLNMQCFAYDYKAEYHKCIDIIKRISNFYLSTVHTEIIIQHFNCVYFNGFNIESHKLYDIYCAIKDFAYKFEYDRLIDNRYIRKCFTDLLNTFYNEIEAETAEEVTVKITDIRPIICVNVIPINIARINVAIAIFLFLNLLSKLKTSLYSICKAFSVF